MSYLILSPEALSSILPLALITGTLLMTQVAFAIRQRVKGKVRYARLDGYEATFLSEFFLNWWLWIFEPAGRFVVRFKVSPNVITWMQLPVAMVASLLFAVGSFGAAGWVVCFGAMLDYLDGLVAKATGQVTASGGFLDSALDRYVDFFILMGMVAYYRHSNLWVIPMIALLGSMAVPYMRAKGESLGVMSQVGGMQRGERIFFLGFSAAMSPLLSAFIERSAEHPVHHVALVGIIIVAIFSNVTATTRARHVMRSLDEREAQKASEQ